MCALRSRNCVLVRYYSRKRVVRNAHEIFLCVRRDFLFYLFARLGAQNDKVYSRSEVGDVSYKRILPVRRGLQNFALFAVHDKPRMSYAKRRNVRRSRNDNVTRFERNIGRGAAYNVYTHPGGYILSYHFARSKKRVLNFFDFAFSFFSPFKLSFDAYFRKTGLTIQQIVIIATKLVFIQKGVYVCFFVIGNKIAFFAVSRPRTRLQKKTGYQYYRRDSRNNFKRDVTFLIFFFNVFFYRVVFHLFSPKAAGRKLDEQCRAVGYCATGDVKITSGFGLPCKFLIHTAVPRLSDKKEDEEKLLASCYENALTIAAANGCESIAFPLLSEDSSGCPIKSEPDIAAKAIRTFLLSNEMDVYLVFSRKNNRRINLDLYGDVLSYINKKAAFASPDVVFLGDLCAEDYMMQSSRFSNKKLFIKKPSSLEDMLKNADDCFTVTLLKLIDACDMSDVECYKKANVSKQTWYKIMNEKNYKPSKNTAVSFAVALGLTLSETERLLATAGYALSDSSKFDIIIKYFILNEIYDVFTINQTLFDFDQPLLGNLR